MLDFDLAELYGIETRVLKQAVRRNSARFEGEDFMFELTKEEISRSQIVILNKGRRRYRRIFPRCSAGMRCIPVTYIDDDIDFL